MKKLWDKNQRFCPIDFVLILHKNKEYLREIKLLMKMDQVSYMDNHMENGT